MKNATTPDITNLFMWWNGRVFTFDTARVEPNSEESSGMAEAELGLYADDDLGVEPTRQNHGGEEVVGVFDRLTLGTSSTVNKIDTDFIVISTACKSHGYHTNVIILTHLRNRR
jgi:hypothetical protein